MVVVFGFKRSFLRMQGSCPLFSGIEKAAAFYQSGIPHPRFWWMLKPVKERLC
jgi:hypothetical protein